MTSPSRGFITQHPSKLLLHLQTQGRLSRKCEHRRTKTQCSNALFPCSPSVTDRVDLKRETWAYLICNFFFCRDQNSSQVVVHIQNHGCKRSSAPYDTHSRI